MYMGMYNVHCIGIYTGDGDDTSDQELFVVERKAFNGLFSGLVQQCGCLSNPSWKIVFHTGLRLCMSTVHEYSMVFVHAYNKYCMVQ